MENQKIIILIAKNVWPMVSRQSSPLATDLSILRMGIGIYRDNVVKTMP